MSTFPETIRRRTGMSINLSSELDRPPDQTITRERYV